MEVRSKTCFKCGARKPLTEFYKHKMMADGHVNKCKECNKTDVRKNRRKNHDYYRAYDRIRGNRLSDSYIDEYREKYKDRAKANQAVNNAVRDKRLTQLENCQWCGSSYRVVAHHCDYSMPLCVTWLCQSCHVQLHKDFDRYKKGEDVDCSWAEEAFRRKPCTH